MPWDHQPCIMEYKEMTWPGKGKMGEEILLCLLSREATGCAFVEAPWGTATPRGGGMSPMLLSNCHGLNLPAACFVSNIMGRNDYQLYLLTYRMSLRHPGRSQVQSLAAPAKGSQVAGDVLPSGPRRVRTVEVREASLTPIPVLAIGPRSFGKACGWQA